MNKEFSELEIDLIKLKSESGGLGDLNLQYNHSLNSPTFRMML